MIQGAIRLGFGQRSSAAAADDPNETGETDAALAVRARVDREAFAALYARYVDPVYRYSLSRLGDREAAEDATSQVFVHALAALPRYREQGSFRSWLFAIAHNVVTDAGRRAGRANSLGGDGLTDDLVDPAPSPEEAVLSAQTAAALRTLLGALPIDQRRVLELRLSGLSSPEVAQILGRSPTAVRSLQFRAVERLRHLLAGEPEMGAHHHAEDHHGHQ